MRNITKIIGTALLACGIFFSACSDMLDTDNDRLISAEDNNLSQASDSLSSVVGILKQLQRISDRYVILGELRGDLLDLTSNSDLDLQAINNFTATPDNPYVTTREYYSVINHCNYYINRVDTTLNEVFKREYAAVKAIRAWTYMQLMLNYGEVTYFEEPILTVSEMNKNHEVYTSMDQLADVLIRDLTPYENAQPLNYGTIDSYSTADSFFPISFLLGDLYLWKGEGYYEMAAERYNYLMQRRQSAMYSSYSNRWANFYFNIIVTNWGMMYNSSSEVISRALFTSDFGENSKLPNLTNRIIPGSEYEYKLAPSEAAMELWASQDYTYSNDEGLTAYNKGDLRGKAPFYGATLSDPSSFSYNMLPDLTGVSDSIPVISKYLRSSLNTTVFFYRTATLYLRYAEALNNAGKPSLAFAVLKYGLSPENIRDSTKVNQSEVTPLPTYCNFAYIPENSNVMGLHGRGSGNVDRDTVYYIFPKGENALKTLADSIRFVDDMILQELALETAFEGNRFQDLMRFAIRRDDNSVLANRVGRKNPAVEHKLMERKNWYLPVGR